MSTRRRNSRAGFSLIEMLMVIGIIIFLIAISVTVIGNIVGSSRVKATRATVRKVNELLMHRADSFQRWLQDSGELDTQNLELSGALAEAGGDEALARVLRTKQLFRDHFPQTNQEAATVFGTDANTDNIDPDPATISAEMLHMFLTAGESFGVELADTEFNASEVADVDEDGLTEVVDSWGNPLRFYRWPTRLIRPADEGSEQAPTHPISLNIAVAELLVAALPSEDTTDVSTNPLTHDPDDPLGLTTSLDSAEFEPNYHTRDTWHAPLVVSAGGDGDLGLFEPNEGLAGSLAQPRYEDGAIPAEAIFDNISSRNLQAGGN